MRFLLLSPELFLADGGIARIMRLYLKALCELAGPNGQVNSLVLNDRPGRDPRLHLYSTDILREQIGCQRGKLRFLLQAIRLGRRSDKLICGHLHQLPIARLARLLNPQLEYYLVAHGIDVWRPYSLAERWALRGAHRILCVSEYTRRQILRFCPGLNPGALVVVPNTLDPHLFPANTAPVAAIREGVGPRILTVGRLAFSDNYKGYDTLIEAMPLVLKVHPGATLRIVGGGDDEARLRLLAGQQGVTGAVTFTGRIDDPALRAEYAACDLFALPSRKEGFGLVFLEAMIHGKPCLGARAGAVPEIINEPVGALADYGNIPEIAAAVTDLVQHPRDPSTIRARADSFAFPAFRRHLASVLSTP
jgi:glycosyltransferase involved in cell wall biosynthesis